MNEHGSDGYPLALIQRRLEMIDTVLFDFDGVLFKTIEDHFASWNHAFASVGVQVKWEDFAVLEGQNFYSIARQLGELYRVTETDMARIAEMKNKHYFSHHQPTPYPDASATIERFLDDQWSLGVVTGAYRERISASLSERWLSYFQVIVTADDVQRTKPDPEPYLTAAKKMNKQPEQCLVIENAPLGVQAAVSASMVCIALTTTLSAGYLKEADYIASGLTDAYQYIKNNKRKA